MRVLLLYQYFVTNAVAGTTRPYELGRKLVEQGHSVTVVTGSSIYFTGEKGSRVPFLWKKQKEDGIEVIRVHVPFGASRRIILRIIGFLYFIPASFVAALTTNKPDVVVASSTPLTIGIPGVLLSRWHRVPFIFELRDLWPDNVVAWSIVSSRLIIRAAYWLESFLYRKAALLIALTAGIRRELMAKGIRPEKVIIITNGSDLDLFNPNGPKADLVRALNVPRGSFVCLHAGSLGLANCLDFLIEVADRLRCETAIQFVVMGTGTQKKRLMQEVTRRGLSNFHFLDAVPKNEVPVFLRRADLGIAFFKPSDLTYIFLPNKFFDYLACGCPVAINFDGEAREYLERYGAGVCVPPNDVDCLAQAIRQLASSPAKAKEMRQAARQLAEDTFGWNRKVLAFGAALSEVVSASRGQRELGKRHARLVKRILDFTLAVGGLVVLFIPMVFVAVVVKLTSPGAVFFRHVRAGLHGRPFSLIKFRTMLDLKDAEGNVVADSARITSFGRFLRSTSLDELPELINVLRGEMSLVGPRPLPTKYLPYYNERERLRHSVLPGMTGWAQIKGRNSLGWDDRLALDVWYVENWSLLLDTRILWKTPAVVLKREGLSVIAEAQTGEVDLDVAREAAARDAGEVNASTSYLDGQFT